MKKYILILLSVLPLSGCFGLVAGAAAGGAAGYAAKGEMERRDEVKQRRIKDSVKATYNKELNQQRQQLQAQIPSPDAQIRNNINAALLGGQLTHVMAIQADVRDGVVTLSGTVPSPIIGERAMAAASQIPGVRGVQSQLMVNERKIEPILNANGQPMRPPYRFVPQGMMQPAYGQPQRMMAPMQAPQQQMQVPMQQPQSMQAPTGQPMAPNTPPSPQAQPPASMQPNYAPVMQAQPQQRMMQQQPMGNPYAAPQGYYAPGTPPGAAYAPQGGYYAPAPSAMAPVQQAAPDYVTGSAVAPASPQIEPVRSSLDEAIENTEWEELERPPRGSGKEHWYPRYRPKSE